MCCSRLDGRHFSSAYIDVCYKRSETGVSNCLYNRKESKQTGAHTCNEF